MISRVYELNVRINIFAKKKTPHNESLGRLCLVGLFKVLNFVTVPVIHVQGFQACRNSVNLVGNFTITRQKLCYS